MKGKYVSYGLGPISIQSSLLPVVFIVKLDSSSGSELVVKRGMQCHLGFISQMKFS